MGRSITLAAVQNVGLAQLRHQVCIAAMPELFEA
jgi:hypothetical protein